MKIFLKNISNTIILSGFLFFLTSLSEQAKARDTAGFMTQKIKGQIFAIKNKNIARLSQGDSLFVGQEIMTEDGGQVSFIDSHNRKFYLISGHVFLGKDHILLKKGYLWFNSHNANRMLSIKTSNSKVSFFSGEGVISFDYLSGKTQLLGIRDELNFESNVKVFPKIKILPGQFTFVDAKYHKGEPRNPTNIGRNSYKKIVSLFHGIKEKDDSRGLFPGDSMKRRSRSSMSMPQVKSTATTKKESLNLNAFYQNELSSMKRRIDKKRMAKFSRKYTHKSGVVVNVFGISKMRSHSMKKMAMEPQKVRRSASFMKVKPKVFGQKKHRSHKMMKVGQKKMGSMAQKMGPEIDQKLRRPSASRKGFRGKNDTFERSLEGHYQNQKPHTQEVSELIHELENYQENFKTTY